MAKILITAIEAEVREKQLTWKRTTIVELYWVGKNESNVDKFPFNNMQSNEFSYFNNDFMNRRLWTLIMSSIHFVILFEEEFFRIS